MVTRWEGRGQVSVEAWLLFRRAFQFLAEERDWDLGEIVMETDGFTLSTNAMERIYLPSIVR